MKLVDQRTKFHNVEKQIEWLFDWCSNKEVQVPSHELISQKLVDSSIIYTDLFFT